MTVEELINNLQSLEQDKEILVEIDGIGALDILDIKKDEKYCKGNYVIYS